MNSSDDSPLRRKSDWPKASIVVSPRLSGLTVQTLHPEYLGDSRHYRIELRFNHLLFVFDELVLLESADNFIIMEFSNGLLQFDLVGDVDLIPFLFLFVRQFCLSFCVLREVSESDGFDHGGNGGTSASLSSAFSTF